MEGTYPLIMQNERVGQVQIRREGLYLCFSCRCHLEKEEICRVQISLSGEKRNLGVLVPEGEGFSLKTRIPAKQLGQGEPEFLVLSNRTASEGTFVPIKPEEPFAYLERLKEAYLIRKNGQVGAWFPGMGE